ncbi:YtxH domain-containing protein [Romeria aff. gracilis LEGE 07310]|uniref:YtxH domain-containing protein n=1 Tax=Vasconcelosia minhoensis LEGE 07310 TaxID=915328 RepID=A0A8J7ASD5_9CYAN|nr:YtxH domain-containing protein [Romeria gracilis]MBE9079816.1 YtxH domain-containing protein [Romeria aff. gracilis LEGE 07310]
MAEHKSSGFLGGVVMGAAIGAVTGLLLAPRSGRETRRILKKSADALPELAEDLSASLQIQADRFSETTLRNWEQTLLRLREAIAAGQAASRREYEHLQQRPEPPVAAPLDE